MSSLIRPEIKLARACMPVLVTNNFDDDPIEMKELAWRQHFPIISLWDFLDALGQLTPQSLVRSGRNSSEILCMSWLPARIKRIGSKTTEKRWRNPFLHYMSMGAFCCHENQSFAPTATKPSAAFTPPQ